MFIFILDLDPSKFNPSESNFIADRFRQENIFADQLCQPPSEETRRGNKYSFRLFRRCAFTAPRGFEKDDTVRFIFHTVFVIH